MSTRRFAAEINISKRSVHRILREELGCFPYKKIKQPRLMNLQKTKRVKFANGVLNNYTRDDTKRWLFSDERHFDIDVIHNVQNDRVWAVSREEVDKRGVIHENAKFPMKVMVWMGV